ncbi:MAG: GAF domain-containing sensor histidine kinase [Ilumatobacteraceae bacterium]
MPGRFKFSGTSDLLHLLDAVMAIGSEQTLADVLKRITKTAAALVDAKYAALGVFDDSGVRLAEFITVGLDDDDASQIGPGADGRGLLGLLIAEPTPIRLPDLHAHPDTCGFPVGHPPMTAFLGVPIRLRGVVYGNLYLTDKVSGGEFNEADQELAVGLAVAAGLAIENARLHEQARTAGLLEERERIARDLHDDVIQRLFATGLSLQAVAHMVTEPMIAERIARAVDDLDVTIRQVRSTIFELHHPWVPAVSLRGDLLAICDESTQALGFRPTCDLEGPIDTAVDEATRGHFLLCVRESLSNVARHANATKVSVHVTVFGNRLTLEVVDDGVGYRSRSDRQSSGVANMRTRAEAIGGTFTIIGSVDRGTSVIWSVPVTAGK